MNNSRVNSVTHRVCKQCKETKRLSKFPVITNYRKFTCQECIDINQSFVDAFKQKDIDQIESLRQYYRELQERVPDCHLPAPVKKLLTMRYHFKITCATCGELQEPKQFKESTTCLSCLRLNEQYQLLLIKEELTTKERLKIIDLERRFEMLLKQNPSACVSSYYLLKYRLKQY